MEKIYELNKFTSKQMAEDFFASEEELKEQQLLNEGWVCCGSWDKDTPEEEVNNLIDKIVADME